MSAPQGDAFRHATPALDLARQRQQYASAGATARSWTKTYVVSLLTSSAVMMNLCNIHRPVLNHYVDTLLGDLLTSTQTHYN